MPADVARFALHSITERSAANEARYLHPSALPKWRTLLALRWQERLEQVTELSLAYYGAEEDAADPDRDRPARMADHDADAAPGPVFPHRRRAEALFPGRRRRPDDAVAPSCPGPDEQPILIREALHPSAVRCLCARQGDGSPVQTRCGGNGSPLSHRNGGSSKLRSFPECRVPSWPRSMSSKNVVSR